MGGKCSPSGGINPPFEGRIGSLDRRGKPNSHSDLYEDGEIIQSRWYGPDGWVIWNRDFKHGDKYNDHKFPHDHEWRWNFKTNQPDRIRKNLQENKNYC